MLFTLSQVRMSESSAYKDGSCFDKKLRTVRFCDLNNESYLNVPLLVGRPYGWLESPLIVCCMLVAFGTASTLEMFEMDAQ